MAWQPRAESFLFVVPVYLLIAIADKNYDTYCLPWGGVGSSYSPLRGHRPTEEVLLFPAQCGETGIFNTVTHRNMAIQMQLHPYKAMKSGS